MYDYPGGPYDLRKLYNRRAHEREKLHPNLQPKMQPRLPRPKKRTKPQRPKQRYEPTPPLVNVCLIVVIAFGGVFFLLLAALLVGGIVSSATHPTHGAATQSWSGHGTSTSKTIQASGSMHITWTCSQAGGEFVLNVYSLDTKTVTPVADVTCASIGTTGMIDEPASGSVELSVGAPDAMQWTVTWSS